MRMPAALVAFLAASVLGAAPASAQNITGTWQISAEGRGGGTMTLTVELEQNGSELTGSIDFSGRGGPRGGGGRGLPDVVEISNGTVDGASFSFTVAIEGGGRGSFAQTFTGQYESDFMEGTIQGGRGGSRPFMGTRGD